jgi:ribosomal-protein-alanine N-acetyltransferase
MMRLRSPQKGDLAQLHALDQACFPQGISYSMAELNYFLVNPRCLCWIAEDREMKLAGFLIAGFLIVERLRRNGAMRGHIITIDVSPEVRQQGVGTLLMRTAEEQMKREGAYLLTLEVAVDNPAAVAFYDRMGFSPTGRIAGYYPGGLDANVMEKVIT